ncbi:hypothetical protein ACFFX0_21585 [Citricoccus parietis]|uniref:Secreted protein n=1 Tax=Citricoccus parietis TaxID=592307 RepID=A0ABV5G3Y3_9MICC
MASGSRRRLRWWSAWWSSRALWARNGTSPLCHQPERFRPYLEDTSLHRRCPRALGPGAFQSRHALRGTGA